MKTLKKIVLPIGLVSILSACGASSTKGVLDGRGGNVNNGPGPVGDVLSCKGQTANHAPIYFFIRHTALLTLDQGILSADKKISKDDEFYYCKNNFNKSKDPDFLWECDRTKPSMDGNSHITVAKVGGKIEATYTIDQIYPLGPKVIAVMSCKEVNGK